MSAAVTWEGQAATWEGAAAFWDGDGGEQPTPTPTVPPIEGELAMPGTVFPPAMAAWMQQVTDMINELRANQQ